MPTDLTFNIFIAYSRKDSGYLNEIRTHFTPLERTGKVTIWYDGKIEPGAVWETEIKERLHTADIILLLVSASAIASDYFYDKEMKDALERHRLGTTKVVPFILRPCAWKATPLAKLQVIPKDGKAATTWNDRDEAYSDAVNSLWEMVSNMGQRRLKVTKAEKETKKEQRSKEEAESKRKAEALRRVEEEKAEMEVGEKSLEKEGQEKERQEKEKLRLNIISSFEKKYPIYWERYESGDYRLFDQLGNKIKNEDTVDSWLGQHYLVFKKKSKTNYILKDFRNKRDGILRPGVFYDKLSTLRIIVIVVGSLAVICASLLLFLKFLE